MLVVDKTLIPSPWTISVDYPMDYPKMDYATEA